MYLKNIILPQKTISGNIFLAPIAGWSDVSFREICSKMGADMCFTEMVSIEGLIRNNKKTAPLLLRANNEKQHAIQLFGANPENGYKAAKIVTDLNPTLIDLNCGCPVPKVSKHNGGVALMQNQTLLAELLIAIKTAINESRKPIGLSIKIRSGINDDLKNYLEILEIATNSGVDMITMHGRTKKQGYTGKSNIEDIKELKENSKIPVIASGDLWTPEDVKNIFDITNCDGVMLARGAMGNPFLFKTTKDFLKKGSYKDISDKEKIDMAKKHLNLIFKYKENNFAVNESKKHLCAYLKGIQNSCALRNSLVHSKEKKEFFKYLNNSHQFF